MSTGNFIVFHESTSVGFFLCHVRVSAFFGETFPGLHQPRIQVGIDQGRIEVCIFVFHTASNFFLGQFAIGFDMILDEKVKIRLDGFDFFRSDFRRSCGSQAFHLGVIRQIVLLLLLRRFGGLLRAATSLFGFGRASGFFGKQGGPRGNQGVLWIRRS